MRLTDAVPSSEGDVLWAAERLGRGLCRLAKVSGLGVLMKSQLLGPAVPLRVSASGGATLEADVLEAARAIAPCLPLAKLSEMRSEKGPFLWGFVGERLAST